MEDFEYKEQYKYLHNICLNITDACNLKCKYCFVEQNPHYMSLETAIAAINWVYDNELKRKQLFPTYPGSNNRSSITFFGGEPTLLWNEVIVPSVKYIRSLDWDVSLSITTNGTLLNEQRIKFLKENHFGILLSMDGDCFTQNFNRPCKDESLQSFSLVEKNIPYILQYYPDVTFRSTIYAPTVDYTFQNYLYAIKKGFKRIYMLPDYRHNWNNEQIITLEKQLDKIYSFMSACFMNGVMPIHFTPIERGFETILQRDIQVSRKTLSNPDIPKKGNYVRCGLGTTLGSIGYDGSIYGCQEQTSKTETNIFYLGNIFKNGIEIDRHKYLLSEYNKEHIKICSNETICKNCLLREICDGLNCPSTTWDLYKNFWIDDEIHCLWNQWIISKNMYLMEKLVSNNNQLFKRFLYKDCHYNKYIGQNGKVNGYGSGRRL